LLGIGEELLRCVGLVEQHDRLDDEVLARDAVADGLGEDLSASRGPVDS
jgi:hypothetical protein